MNSSAESVASYIKFLDPSVSETKMMKLMYYAQALSCGLLRDRLFNEKIIHKKHGAFISELHHKVNQLHEGHDSWNASSDHKKLVSSVVRKFCRSTATQLSEKCHREDPWKKTFYGEEMTPEMLINYFDNDFILNEYADIIEDLDAENKEVFDALSNGGSCWFTYGPESKNFQEENAIVQKLNEDYINWCKDKANTRENF